jgi:hypothetical protein
MLIGHEDDHMTHHVPFVPHNDSTRENSEVSWSRGNMRKNIIKRHVRKVLEGTHLDRRMQLTITGAMIQGPTLQSKSGS